VAGEIQYQETKQRTESKSSSDNLKHSWLKSVEPRAGATTSKAPKEGETKSFEASIFDSSEDEPAQRGQKGAVQDTATEARKVSVSATIPTAHTAPSYHNSADSKPVAHRIDSNKKLKKQIRNIRTAITQEKNRPGKTNTGILKGLKKTLEKLIAARNYRNQSPISQPPENQKRSQPPHKESSARNPYQLKPNQTPASPETQPSPKDIERIQSQSSTSTNEEHLPTVSASAPQLLLAEAQPTNMGSLTSESESAMSEISSFDGKKGREGRESASADLNMTDAEATVADYFPLTDECHHYTRRSDVLWDIQKYVPLSNIGSPI
jgi:hypothetical protein